MSCHNDGSALVARNLQYQNSVHATGHAFERSSSRCASCHTNEGFQMSISGETVVDIANPTPPNCRTCHKIHENYDSTDLELRVAGTGPITLDALGETAEYGKGNVCAECHQPRADAPSGTDSISITSFRYGPHYGAQASMLKGMGGYNGAGIADTIFGPHSNANNTCINCHMATPVGATAGGHQMGLEYEDHGHAALLTTGCTECHDQSDFAGSNHNGLADTVAARMDSLKARLIAVGVMDSSGYAVPGKYPVGIAGAFFNYKVIDADNSKGVHNPDYTKALLEQSFSALP